MRGTLKNACELVAVVNDLEQVRDLAAETYRGADAAPCWSGVGRPSTSLGDQIVHAGVKASDFCAWNLAHFGMYELLAVLADRPSRTSALDLGCGTGHRARWLAELYDHVVGFDPDVAAIEKAQRLHGSAHDNLRFVPAYPEKFGPYDDVYCVEVLEHVEPDDHGLFVANALATLRDGGLLLITTPREEVRAPPHVGTLTWRAAEEFRERFRANIKTWIGLKVPSNARLLAGEPVAVCGRDFGTHHLIVVG